MRNMSTMAMSNRLCISDGMILNQMASTVNLMTTCGRSSFNQRTSPALSSTGATALPGPQPDHSPLRDLRWRWRLPVEEPRSDRKFLVIRPGAVRGERSPFAMPIFRGSSRFPTWQYRPVGWQFAVLYRFSKAIRWHEGFFGMCEPDFGDVAEVVDIPHCSRQSCAGDVHPEPTSRKRMRHDHPFEPDRRTRP